MPVFPVWEGKEYCEIDPHDSAVPFVVKYFPELPDWEGNVYPLEGVVQLGIPPPETVNTCPEVPIDNLAGVLAEDA